MRHATFWWHRVTYFIRRHAHVTVVKLKQPIKILVKIYVLRLPPYLYRVGRHAYTLYNANIVQWYRVGLLWLSYQGSCPIRGVRFDHLASSVRTPLGTINLNCDTCPWVKQSWHSSPSHKFKCCRMANASAWHLAHWPWDPFTHNSQHKSQT